MLVCGYGRRHYLILYTAPTALVGPVHYIQVPEGAFNFRYRAAIFAGTAALKPPQLRFKGLGVLYATPFLR